jgi:hypothetical protein
MPLVVFRSTSTEVLDRTPFTVNLNSVPKQKEWKLKHVTATYFNTTSADFRILEIECPVLFDKANVHFFHDYQVSIEPRNALAFYVNHMMSAGNGQDSYFKSIDVHPDIDFGRLSLDSQELTIYVSARQGSGNRSPVALNDFCIVFECIDY